MGVWRPKDGPGMAARDSWPDMPRMRTKANGSGSLSLHSSCQAGTADEGHTSQPATCCEAAKHPITGRPALLPPCSSTAKSASMHAI